MRAYFAVVFLILLLSAFGLSQAGYSTSIEVSGDVSGQWDVDTVFVIAEISVPDQQTLTIDPGVYIEFQGHYKFNVQGQLLAIGTETDTICFTINDTTGFSNMEISDGGWHGIQFDSTSAENDTSRIMYCLLQYGKAVGADSLDQCGGAIFVDNFSKLLISHCLIVNNRASWTGAGILCRVGANPIISNNSINNNLAISEADSTIGCSGAAVGILGCSPIVTNNIMANNIAQSPGDAALGAAASIIGPAASPIFENNTMTNNVVINYGGETLGAGGAAIFIEAASPIFINNVISYNRSYSYAAIPLNTGGGGVAVYLGSEATLIGNLIVGNTISGSAIAGAGGGGVAIWLYSDATLINNTIAGNSCLDSIPGGAIMVGLDSHSLLINNVIWGNTADEASQIYLWDETADPDFYYCDIEGGLEGFGGNGAGDNYDGNYENNIDSNPVFSGDGEHPYAIQGTSPCIEAGDPDTTGLNLPEFDLAGNSRIYGDYIDIGAYEYQGSIDVDLPNHLFVPKFTTLHQNYPNPFNPKTIIKFDLPEANQVTLQIYDVSGKLVRTLVNEQKESGYHSVLWNGKDNRDRAVNSGLYFYKIETKGFSQTKQMILLK